MRQTEEECSIGLSPDGGVGRRLGVTVDEKHWDGTSGGDVATVVCI